MTAKDIILIVAAVLLVLLSGLLSGAEMGIYRLSRLRLRLGVERKLWPYRILGKIMHDSSGMLLSLLISTNIANYVTTSIVAYLLLTRLQAEQTTELFATLITAPVLFVFAELIPKNVFFYRTDSLMPRAAPALYFLHRVLTWCGAVWLFRVVWEGFARLAGSGTASRTVITAVQGSYVKTILQETKEETFLSSVQADLLNRLAIISNTSVKLVMSPFEKTHLADVNSNRQVLLGKLRDAAFTRLPVYENEPSNIIGYIDIYECLCSGDEFADLRNFVKNIGQIGAETNVCDAINLMQGQNRKIALVTRGARAGKKRLIGIVTMQDLVEELLVELSE